jgi:hypothetical protein
MFVHQAPLTGKTFLDLGPVELNGIAAPGQLSVALLPG